MLAQCLLGQASNEFKMLDWARHLMKMHSCNVTASDPAAALTPAGGSKPG